MGEVVEREAARVLVFDARDRLLLFRGFDPADRERGAWWFTPGGGLDPGETHREGARRELREETGLDLDLPYEPVWERTIEFPYDGVRYRQHELFFAVRVAQEFHIRSDAWTELEIRAIAGYHWWTHDEVLAATEPVHPDVLREMFGRFRAAAHDVTIAAAD